MEMQMVMASFRGLCAMPIAWAIFAAIAVRALWSLLSFFTCPIVRQTARMDAIADRDALAQRFLHSPRFLIAMLIGIALSVGGLYALQRPEVGPLALAAIVFGVAILIVEPSRLSVEENTLRVSAARLEGWEAYAFALDRLRASHIERIAIELAMVGVVGIVIAAY